MENLDEAEREGVVEPEEGGGWEEVGGEGGDEEDPLHGGVDGPDGEDPRGVRHLQQVPAILPNARHPTFWADALDQSSHFQGTVAVENFCDAGEYKGEYSSLYVLRVIIEGKEEADSGLGGFLEVPTNDRDHRVVEDQDDEKSQRDDPVELVEESQVGQPAGHEASIGKADENDAENKVEEQGVEVEANNAHWRLYALGRVTLGL